MCINFDKSILVYSQETYNTLFSEQGEKNFRSFISEELTPFQIQNLILQIYICCLSIGIHYIDIMNISNEAKERMYKNITTTYEHVANQIFDEFKIKDNLEITLNEIIPQYKNLFLKNINKKSPQRIPFVNLAHQIMIYCNLEAFSNPTSRLFISRLILKITTDTLDIYKKS